MCRKGFKKKKIRTSKNNFETKKEQQKKMSKKTKGFCFCSLFLGVKWVGRVFFCFFSFFVGFFWLSFFGFFLFCGGLLVLFSQKREKDFTFFRLFVLLNKGSRVVVSLCCEFEPHMKSPKKEKTRGKNNRLLGLKKTRICRVKKKEKRKKKKQTGEQRRKTENKMWLKKKKKEEKRRKKKKKRRKKEVMSKTGGAQTKENERKRKKTKQKKKNRWVNKE